MQHQVTPKIDMYDLRENHTYERTISSLMNMMKNCKPQQDYIQIPSAYQSIIELVSNKEPKEFVSRQDSIELDKFKKDLFMNLICNGSNDSKLFMYWLLNNP